MRLNCLAFAFLFSCLAAAHADDRLPIPDEAAQKETDALVKDVFGEEIAKARTPDEQAALTKKLRKEAEQATTAGNRYALLKASLRVAPDAKIAMSVIDEMAKHFQIEGMQAKAYSLKKISESAVTPTERKSLAESSVELANYYIEQDNFPAASALIDIALEAATKSRDSQLIRDVRAKKDDVDFLQEKYAAVQAALATLETDPTEAKSNSIVGKYKCFVKGDWEGGLPMLALGTDEVLKRLAVQELKMPVKSDEQVALADGWYELAQKAGESNKERMLQRAGFWYQLSLKSEPTLARLVEAKVEKRLGDATESKVPKDEVKLGGGVLKDWQANEDFQLKDGILKYNGLAATLAVLLTKESYTDFELALDYRFPINGRLSRTGSGVWLWTGPGGIPNNLEVQLLPGSSGDLWVGKNIRLDTPKELIDRQFPSRRKRSPKAVEKPPGEWNSLSIQCKEGAVFVQLNGVAVNGGRYASRTTGPVGLVSQGSEVEFREIRLRQLK